MLASFTGWHLIIVIVLLLFVVPTLIVVPKARKRSAAVQSGELVLQEKTNTLAVVGFVLSFFLSIAAVVIGHLGLSQINRTNERGWGLGVAALWLGYAGIAAGLLVVVASVLAGAAYR